MLAGLVYNMISKGFGNTCTLNLVCTHCLQWLNMNDAECSRCHDILDDNEDYSKQVTTRFQCVLCHISCHASCTRLACMYTSVLHVHEQVQQLARVFVSNVNIWLSSAKLQFCCVLVSKCLVFISTLQLFTRPTLFFYVALAELHLTKRTKQFAVCLVAWRSSRTSVFDQRTFPVLRSTYSWRVTTYAGKPSAVGQLTRPTQPFILSRSIWRTPSPVSGSAVWWTLTR